LLGGLASTFSDVGDLSIRASARCVLARRHVQPLNQKRKITIEMKESFPPKIHLTKLTNKEVKKTK
jgi:hypothetical protein